MNLRDIISSTESYNFHSHTQFCDGHDTIETMASAAVEAGFLHFGFSPHSPFTIPSPCNMKLADMEKYKNEVARVRDLYAGKCQFYTGLEIDYLGPECGPASQPYQDFNLDYSIGSIHFIRNRRGEHIDIDGHFDAFGQKMDKFFGNDIRYVVEEFYRASSEMLASGGFDILGHFDKISQNASYFRPGIEDEPWYQDIVSDYISQIISSGVIVEINTKARDEHGRFFPNERYWPRLVEANVPIAVNSDAHYASRVNASRQEAIKLLNGLSTHGR